VALVDLRGRESEPAVRALAGVDGGLLVGWEADGELVGCIGLTRDERCGLVLRSVAVAAGRQGQGIGRAMVDALADVATTDRLIAESDAESVGFFEQCGFTVEPAGPGRFSCTRSIDPTPAPSEPAITLTELERAIRSAWSAETSADPDEWSEENPARGQCDVTALLVRELLGGEILIANVIRDGERVERHGWNRLASGLVVDLTRSQFRRGERFDEPKVGEPIGVQRAPERYELFSARVDAELHRS
jgi:GNAT superfamily N-acetyltransferase